jgi:hypothetical protein
MVFHKGMVWSVFAALATLSLYFCSGVSAQGNEAAALKQRVLSKIKACDCEKPLAVCGDCSVAGEIKVYVDRLIEAKIPEDKMLGYIIKSFGVDVSPVDSAKEDASKQVSQVLPPDTPRMEADMLPYDLGKVSKSAGSIRHEFTLRNNGNKDLIIKNVRTSCVCAKASLKTDSAVSPNFDFKGSGPEWQGTVKPGETAILEIVIDLATFPIDPKPVTRDVLITSNDPIQPFAIFKVSLEVTGP